MEDHLDAAVLSTSDLREGLGELLVVQASVEFGSSLGVLDRGKLLSPGSWVDVGELHLGGPSVQIVDCGTFDSVGVECIG